MTMDPKPWLERETNTRYSNAEVDEANAKDRCWRGLRYDPRPEFEAPDNPQREDFLVRVAKQLRLLRNDYPTDVGRWWKELPEPAKQGWIQNARDVIDGSLAEGELLVLADVQTEEEVESEEYGQGYSYERSWIDTEFIVAHALTPAQRTQLAAAQEDWELRPDDRLDEEVRKHFGPELEADRERRRRSVEKEWLPIFSREEARSGAVSEGTSDS